MSESSVELSQGEKLFILHGIQVDCRPDGRRCFDYRQIEFETNVISNCHGSAHVRIGTTDILVGVKAEITEPSAEEQDKGIVEFAADFSANASPAFEGHGGESIVNELVAVLNHAVLTAIDRKKLCVVPGRSVWTLYVDILVLEFASKPNLFDAAGIGVKAALFDTKIPMVSLNADSDDLEIVEEDEKFLSFLDIQRIPLILTLTRISGRYIVDATVEEESASVSSIILAIDSQGQVVHSKKMGVGTLLAEPLKDVLPAARKLLLDLDGDLMRRLEGRSS